MKTKKFTYPITIKEIYLDSFGHMNNATYLMLFEEARWELINQNGYGIEKIKTTGLGPTILELKVKYLKELFPRDEIIIETSLASYEKKIGRLEQTMVRNGEICCKAEFVIALFDLKARKLVAPTADWLKGIGVALEPKSEADNI